MTATVAISGFFKRHQQSGGVYSYFQNLLRGMADVCGEQGHTCQITVFHGEIDFGWCDERLTWRKQSDRGSRFWTESRFGAFCGAKFDSLLFPNYFTPPIVRAERSVTVIHDLQYCHLPQMWSPAKRLWMRGCHWLTLLKADRVISISHAVKEDMLRQYGERYADQIVPIWNPICLERLEGTAQPDVTGGRPYILCVSVDRPQKNLTTLIRAFARLRDRFPEHCLVLTGQLRSQRRSRRERLAQGEPAAADLVRDLGLRDHVRVTGFVTDADLGALYRQADVFVLPSLFEGFGMSAVESMAMGTATLVSDLPVLREVTMNAAHYLSNPRDDTAMADRLAAILTNVSAARPTTVVKDALQDAFSPSTIARKYLQVLLDIDA